MLAIKESLLQFDNGSAFVEVATAPQVFQRKTVELGLSDGINVEILSGLSRTDRIKVWDRPKRR